MYSYKISVVHAQVSVVELWEETPNKRFCKISIIRDRQRFIVQTDYLGRGFFAGINVPKSLDKALEGFPDFFVEKAKWAFEANEVTLGEVLAIFPNAAVEFPKVTSRR